MELEKLKEIWTSLDNRMQQQEGLKAAIIKEMLINKSDKALSRLINYSYFGLILEMIGIPVLIWCWIYTYNVLYKVLMFAVLLFVISGMVCVLIQLVKLNKVDFSMPVKNNSYIIQNVKIFNKRVNFSAYIIGIVLFITVLIMVLYGNLGKMESWRWMVITMAIPIGVIGSIWEYKRIYSRNFNSILKSLEELRELEEPEDLYS